MSIWEVIIVSIGLSLDAFTVAVCKGATHASLKKATALLSGIIFGAIQTLMLGIGMCIAWFPMIKIDSMRMISINTWFSAIILIFLGIKIIKNACKEGLIEERRDDFFSYKGILFLAFATSVDALILGISLGLLATNILTVFIIIFISTAILVAAGMWTGYSVGDKHRKKIDIIAGLILFFMGIRVIIKYFNII